MTGQAMTVVGAVAADQLGRTLMHEHLLIDGDWRYPEPSDPAQRRLWAAPLTMDLLGLHRRDPFRVTLDNVSLNDEDVAATEVARFRDAGGATVVDVTSIGLSRRPDALRRIAVATGLNVIAATGCYVEAAHPGWVARSSVDELADRFVADVQDGIDGSGVRAGIIGEIGTSGVEKRSRTSAGAMTAAEEKVLRAAGRAACRTGAAVTVHVDLRHQGALEIIDVLEQEGLPPDRMILGHLDMVPDLDYHREVARRGAYVEYDCIGREYYIDSIGVACGHDTWRVQALLHLIADGYGDRILLSQDIATKMDLCRYGGFGYAHVLSAFRAMLERAGLEPEQFDTLTIANPARVLALRTELPCP